MPIIETDIVIPAPLEAVYAVAKDIEKFPEFLPDVKSVVITERAAGRYVSEWVGIVEKLNRTIKWTEEDLWDDATHVCTFRALGGDWDKYDGVWSFTEVDGGTRMSMKLDVDINVPLIGALIKTLIGKLAKENVDGMFAGIRKRTLGEV
ncbi:MAG: SRPBCC family protein [bacterium]